MAQLVKCPHTQDKGLSLDPSTLLDKSWTQLCMPRIPAQGRQRQKDPWTLLASQYSQIRSVGETNH